MQLVLKSLNQLNCIKALDESKEQMKKDHNEEEYTNITFYSMYDLCSTCGSR